MDTKNINTTALAYIGDAVYEVYIREYVMKNGAVHADRLHREAVRYVSAAGQAKAIRKMFDSLDEEEQKLVKRARNHKYSSKAMQEPTVHIPTKTKKELRRQEEALFGKLPLKPPKKL